MSQLRSDGGYVNGHDLLRLQERATHSVEPARYVHEGEDDMADPAAPSDMIWVDGFTNSFLRVKIAGVSSFDLEVWAGQALPNDEDGAQQDEIFHYTSLDEAALDANFLQAYAQVNFFRYIKFVPKNITASGDPADASIEFIISLVP